MNLVCNCGLQEETPVERWGECHRPRFKGSFFCHDGLVVFLSRLLETSIGYCGLSHCLLIGSSKPNALFARKERRSEGTIGLKGPLPFSEPVGDSWRCKHCFVVLKMRVSIAFPHSRAFLRQNGCPVFASVLFAEIPPYGCHAKRHAPVYSAEGLLRTC